MDRRSFLKLCGVTAAITVAPVLAKTYPERFISNSSLSELSGSSLFNPSNQYGNAVQVTGLLKDSGKEQKRRIYNLLHEDMARVVPDEYFDKVHFTEREGDGSFYEPGHYISWHYSPDH